LTYFPTGTTDQRLKAFIELRNHPTGTLASFRLSQLQGTFLNPQRKKSKEICTDYLNSQKQVSKWGNGNSFKALKT
jgi:hypothetical protein